MDMAMGGKAIKSGGIAMRSENSPWGDWGSLGMNPYGTGRAAAPPARRDPKPEQQAAARVRRMIEERREQRELMGRCDGY